MVTILSILLIVLGVLGLIVAGAAFGDIGIAAGIGSLAALLSGFAILLQTRQ